MNELDIELLSAAIDELPEDMRDVVNGLFYERASYRALAARLGVTKSKVEALRAEAMVELRGLVERAMEVGE